MPCDIHNQFHYANVGSNIFSIVPSVQQCGTRDLLRMSRLWVIGISQANQSKNIQRLYLFMFTSGALTLAIHCELQKLSSRNSLRRVRARKSSRPILSFVHSFFLSSLSQSGKRASHVCICSSAAVGGIVQLLSARR